MCNWLSLLRGALGIPVVVLAVACLNFLVIQAAPGDPVAVIAGESGAADAALNAQLRQEFGLDRPLPEQLLRYLGRTLTLDLGYSYRQREPVAGLIVDRLPATLLLATTAFLLALGAGVLAGAISARGAGGWLDRALNLLTLTLHAVPVFWLGLLGILLFSVHLEWLPAFGMEQFGAGLTGWSRAWDVARHLVLPACTLAFFHVAPYARVTRAAMLDVYGLDHVKTAVAKGLHPRLVVRRHVLRNALPPVLTLAGLQAGQLVSGAVLVETVFAWPGIGRLAFDALLQRDYPVLLGVFLVASVVVIFFNLVTDLLRRRLDPRSEATP